MEFISETRDYNPAEFHDNFGHDLPRIVTVNQGFYGEVLDDTFARGQVIRIHMVSRQPRVVAKSVQGTVTSLYSIPLTYPEHMCVVSKHGGAGKEQPLNTIIQNHKLPVSVQFPKQRAITIGSTPISTNHIPTMELTQNFDEMYLLGNSIIDGVVSHYPVHVPLYLSDLRLSLITAIKGQTLEKWTSYQQEINNTCKQFHYDAEFGNPAVYRPNDVHDDTLYEKLEPATYTNITALFPRKSEPNIYQNIDLDKPKKPTPLVFHKPPMNLPQDNNGGQDPPTLPHRLRPPKSTQSQSPITNPTNKRNIPSATDFPISPPKTNIEFTTDKLDFYVSDFIKSYEHELPHVVMVNQGYKSFAKEQVMTIQAVSRQERVIVKPKARDNTKVYSFPLTYHVGAQIISQTGALGKEQSLNEILSKFSLPVTVKFNPTKTMTTGNQNISTGNLGAMELVQVFDEAYLLGNFIIDGKMADEVTYIPKYLRPLKLSLVIGIEGKSAALWYNFTAGLERDSNTQEYDLEYGNPDIAEYRDDLLTSRDHACVEPIRYCNFAEMFQQGEKGISNYARSIPVDDTYDEYVDLTEVDHSPASNTNKHDPTDKQVLLTAELANKFKKMKQKQDGTAVCTLQPGVVTKPRVTKPASELPKIGKYALKTKEQYSNPPTTPNNTSVALVKASTTTPTETETALKITKEDDIYENDFFKKRLPTTKANKPENASIRQVSHINPIQHGVKGTALLTVTNAEDVRKLTINEVGEYLKLLNLNTYVETFKNEMVDGTFLVDMDEELLKDDFDFKRIEAKRLLMFTSKGHVPR